MTPAGHRTPVGTHGLNRRARCCAGKSRGAGKVHEEREKGRKRVRRSSVFSFFPLFYCISFLSITQGQLHIVLKLMNFDKSNPSSA